MRVLSGLAILAPKRIGANARQPRRNILVARADLLNWIGFSQL
jgi:hypothetical protein